MIVPSVPLISIPLSIFAPAGIGVQEAVKIAVFANVISWEKVLLVLVALRVIRVCVDLIAFSIVKLIK